MLTREAKATRATIGAQRRFGLLLGLITLSGPLAINLYVPAFGVIARSLSTTVPTVQLSHVAYTIALAIGQNIYGPLSDRHGRKLPLAMGLLLFIGGSIGCAFAMTVAQLIVWRFLEGLGACVAMTLPRAIVRDVSVGTEATRQLGLIILIGSGVPLLAPLVGSALTAATSWRAMFWLLTLSGLLSLVLTLFRLPETRPVATRVDLPVGAVFKDYGHLLADRQFLGVGLVVGMAQAAGFSFVGGSPFVFITLFGIAPWKYSVLFAIICGGWAIGAQFAAPLVRRWGARYVLIVAMLLNVFMAALALGLLVAGLAGPAVLAALFFVQFFAGGLIAPAGTVLAFDRYPAIAGTASALFGTIGFFVSALVGMTTSLLANGTALPLTGAALGCAAMGLLSVWLAFGTGKGASGAVGDSH